MEIEHLIRYTELAVGLKPSAMQGKARLRGLYRIISSKTISADGVFLGTWSINDPLGIAVAPDGTIYVTDTINGRIQRFNATGTFLGA